MAEEASPPGSQPAAQPAAAAPPADPPSIFDAAGEQGKPADKTEGHPVNAPKAPDPNGRPEGLDDAFWDAEKNQVRVDALIASQKDLRGKIARGEHKPPAKADDYTLPKVEGVPEIAADDPVWKQVREAAHKRGMPQAEFSALAEPFLRAAAEAMKSNPPPPSEAEAKAEAEARVAAEVEKLGPSGRALIGNLATWMNGLEASGVITADEKAALRGISDANGVRALAKLRGLAGGEPIPLDAVPDGQMSQAEAERMMQEGYAKNDQTMIAKARARLEALEQAGKITGRFARTA